MARALRAKVFYRGKETEQAIMALDGCDFLLDAGGRQGNEDAPSRRLIQAAREHGLPILTRNAVGMPGARHYESLPELVDALEELSWMTGKRGVAK